MANQDTTKDVLATLRPSGGRRILGIGSMALLGVTVIYVALAQPPVLYLQVFLLVVGAAALWCADAMRRAMGSAVELTEAGLRDVDGTIIAEIDQIESVDRGFFAFKPSNGFLLKTRTPGARAWRPGLWWRMGRRIGVGGMTAASQAKFMSEILAALIARRELGEEGLDLSGTEKNGPKG